LVPSLRQSWVKTRSLTCWKSRESAATRFSRAMGARLLTFASESNTTRRMELFRDATKRLIRKMAVQSVFVMTPEQIDEFVTSLFLESATALGISARGPKRPHRARAILRRVDLLGLADLLSNHETSVN
jgi:hypothetical protein